MGREYEGSLCFFACNMGMESTKCHSSGILRRDVEMKFLRMAGWSNFVAIRKNRSSGLCFRLWIK